MATKRRKIGAHAIRHAATMPEAVRWWLANGGTMPGGEPGAWETYLLQYDHTPAPKSRMWSRQDLIELGYGRQIDAHVQAGRCPPSGWRKPIHATAI
jgi:hypothetical protein